MTDIQDPSREPDLCPFTAPHRDTLGRAFIHSGCQQIFIEPRGSDCCARTRLCGQGGSMGSSQEHGFAVSSPGSAKAGASVRQARPSGRCHKLGNQEK